MKILLINDFIEKVGGAEQVVYSTMNILQAHGHDTLLYAPTINSRSIPASVFSFRHYRAIRRLIQEFKPDIVHAHGIYRNVSPSVLLAARSFRVPIVMTLHDFHLVCPKTSLVDGRHLNCETGFGYHCLLLNCYPRIRFSRIYQCLKMIKLSLHRAIIRSTVHQFLPPSFSLMNWTKKNFDSENVTLLPYLLMTEHEPSPQPPRTRTLLYIGHLTEQKGVDVLLRAIAKTSQIIPDISLKIVGAGDCERMLKELAASLKITGNITFVGNLANEQVIHEYDDAYCVIIPSKYVENLSVVGLEAIAKGKVVIASRIGGLPDIVDHNETGFLVRPGDPDDLAEKIIYVMQHPAILPDMGRRAHAKFLRTFSKQAYYRTVISVYDRIIHEARNSNAQL
ncbi:MAG: glycosyltransferase family 4 protein [Geobacteraceae bacterium]|nr:glycosyltransferase family 4 protein [Geobacteraceae bacterium]